MGVNERLSSAMRSDDMGMVADRVKDADYIAGLGMAGIRNRLGSAILRLKLSHDTQTYMSAATMTHAIVRKLDTRNRWGLAQRDVTEIAHKALRHHLLPVCRRCNGTKWDVVPGTPSLSSTPCCACNGTGVHPLPRKHGKEIAEVVAMLDAIEHQIESSTNHAMR